MTQLQPKSLAVVVAIHDLGSATEAARSLCISQPAVSYHLRKLERVVGASLFRRTPAGLVATSVGTVLVRGARPILASLEELDRDARAAARGEARPVRVSSACFTNYHWIPEVLAEFRRECGEIGVELDVDPSRRPFEALDRGLLDVALTTVPPAGEAYALVELFDDEIVAVVSPDHALAERREVTPSDFADQSVVVFDRSQSDLFNLVLAPAGIAPKEVTDVPVTDALLGLVRSGVAVSAMASWVAAPDLAGGRLRALRIGRRGLHRTWWAVLSERHPPPPAVSRFVEILKRTCRNVPGADRAEA